MPVNQFLRRAQPTPYAARRINQELYMSSSDRGRDDATGTQRDPAVPADSPTPGTDAYANWLGRTQPARARQAAITRDPYTRPNYKRWADQARDSWHAPDSSGASVATEPRQ